MVRCSICEKLYESKDIANDVILDSEIRLYFKVVLADGSPAINLCRTCVRRMLIEGLSNLETLNEQAKFTA